MYADLKTATLHTLGALPNTEACSARAANCRPWHTRGGKSHLLVLSTYCRRCQTRLVGGLP